MCQTIISICLRPSGETQDPCFKLFFSFFLKIGYRGRLTGHDRSQRFPGNRHSI